ncbi:hypothetical protein TBKG_00812 [Mycobacterium tuberculosis '98-R604 INH-RIF-EM']|nr:predicted protein [Mycobacterium tuberculosis T17]EFD62539.1 predicted protein [Mycobacterium tuberculosis EAS054]EPZ65475.1 hypothetical protein TBKG_00812 [Mycobacterium tuberculosis '98-R604 INH-RIF-EM']MXI71225.1 hypothetical protein [Mycobacterium tuberculosis]
MDQDGTNRANIPEQPAPGCDVHPDSAHRDRECTRQRDPRVLSRAADPHPWRVATEAGAQHAGR